MKTAAIIIAVIVAGAVAYYFARKPAPAKPVSPRSTAENMTENVRATFNRATAANLAPVALDNLSLNNQINRP